MLLEGLKVFAVAFVVLEGTLLLLCEFTKMTTDLLFDKWKWNDKERK